MMRIAMLGALMILATGALATPAPAHGPAASVGDLGFPRFDYQPPAPGTYQLPAIKPAPDARVVDAAGTPRRLHGLMGDRIVVVSFISTRCVDPQGCPLATAVLHQIRAVAGHDPMLVRRLRLITVSFDLLNDRPAVLARYAGAAGKGPARTSPWEFGQRTAPPTHLLRVYLIDAERRIRNIYGLDFLDARLLLTDVRTLLLEEQGRRP
jgi:cytochrome oxidase Cu insertion factor (SCO1/SenC/PrrC family)